MQRRSRRCEVRIRSAQDASQAQHDAVRGTVRSVEMTHNREVEFVGRPNAETRKENNNVKITMIKSFLPAAFAVVFSLAIPAFTAGQANDPVSGLPLAPGMNPSNDPLTITICGKPAQANQYSLIFGSDTVPAEIAWYKAHLPGYHMVHAFWDNRSQDTFFSPDGTKGVNITGTPKSDKAFSVMYLTLKTRLTEHQWMVFSPSNPTCK